jgi:hypothetical protein
MSSSSSSSSGNAVAAVFFASCLSLLAHVRLRRRRRKLQIRQVGNQFGAEVTGVSLRYGEISTEEVERIKAAFYDSGGLLLVRGQPDISPDDLLQFARNFGDLEMNDKYDRRFLMPDRDEILRVGNLKGEDGKFDSLFVQADQSPLLWHADDSFRSPQPLGSILYCAEAPQFDGSEEQEAFKEVVAHKTDCVFAYYILLFCSESGGGNVVRGLQQCVRRFTRIKTKGTCRPSCTPRL